MATLVCTQGSDPTSMSTGSESEQLVCISELLIIDISFTRNLEFDCGRNLVFSMLLMTPIEFCLTITFP